MVKEFWSEIKTQTKSPWRGVFYTAFRLFVSTEAHNHILYQNLINFRYNSISLPPEDRNLVINSRLTWYAQYSSPSIGTKFEYSIFFEKNWKNRQSIFRFREIERRAFFEKRKNLQVWIDTNYITSDSEESRKPFALAFTSWRRPDRSQKGFFWLFCCC